MNILENNMMSKMSKLVEELNKASDSYYNTGKSILTDYEYDAKLAELQKLEVKLNKVLPNSPTKNVGYEVVDSLKKVKHKFPAKSLDKTKDMDELLEEFIEYKPDYINLVVVMWKLDGATIQLTYEKGKLVQAATRGNGKVGQDITHNAKYIKGIPQTLKAELDITVRGEAVMSYQTFDEINSKLDPDNQYSNPRNLAAATITMLDSKSVADRDIHFQAFELVDHKALDKLNFVSRLYYLQSNGFDVVDYVVAPDFGADEVMYEFTARVNDFEYPVDGLVVALNDAPYADSLKGTEHHPHHFKGYAYKWEDETATTILRDIEWSPSRTGLLNPVAIFDTVDLEGTKVSRASLHNFSILKNLHLHIGDEIEVYKANKIIPQVVSNKTDSPNFDFADCELDIVCPTCGFDGMLKVSPDGIENIICPNSDCKSKVVEKLIHFCSRDCMDIEGLSDKTIEKFVDLGFLSSFTSIYLLDQHCSKIVQLDSFGETSCNKLLDAIEKSRHTNMVKFLSALGIPGIGTKQAKVLSEYFKGDIDNFMSYSDYDYTKLDGFGQVLSNSLNSWMNDKSNREEVLSVIQLLDFEGIDNYKLAGSLEGITFVITGSLNHFTNRKELEMKIAELGGTVSSSVSKKTNYLINNDLTSTSSKNKKAMELGLPIITEDDFINMFMN